MKENRKKTIRTILLILILFLGVGYAALKTTLKIDGTVDVDKATWDVHFENVQITNGSVTANPAPTTNNTDTTEMTYTINFTKPGDYFEFTTDIVNEGTIDAMVDVVSNNAYASAASTTPMSLPPYLTNTVTYDDGVPINKNHLLAKNTSKKIKVRVEFKKDITAADLPSDGDTTVVFKFNGSFKQADETSCPKATTFEDDSWETIQCNVKENTESYPVGATKTIQMVDYGTRVVRVANNTTPQECSTTGFSQTACGFVVEYTNVLEDWAMKSSNSTGGWPATNVRQRLNNNIMQKMPSALQDVIIDTTVVSGHNSVDAANFTTTDKIYLLDAPEIYGSSFTSSIHTAKDKERQLDYYKLKGVTTSRNYSEAKKTKTSGAESDWWLRSASSDGEYYFFYITGSGSYYNDPAYGAKGLSPAFRIG